MTMTKRFLVTVGSLAAVLAFGLGCSTDSPTAPVQNPGPPPGTGSPSARWNIQVAVSPSELTIGSAQPSTVAIRVRRADNGQPPANGTTIVVSTSLGDFGSAGSGQNSAALSTVGGQASVFLFAGSVAGTALVSAQLEASVGQRTVAFREQIEAVQAAFSFQNSENNLSVQFLNQSTGDPTEFLWDFGDGKTSTEENPHHIFPAVGDYAVSLTVSKQGSSDKTSQLVLVGEFIPLVADFSFINTEQNLSVQFQDLSQGDPTRWTWDFGDGSGSREQNPVHSYARAGDYVVTLEVRRGSETAIVSKIVTVGQPLDLFIDFISPATGPGGGGTLVTITGNGFGGRVAVKFGSKFGNVQSVSSTAITVLTPPADLGGPQPCDTNGDGTDDGTQIPDLPVDVTVELENGPTATVSSGFTYLSGAATCS